MNAVQWAELIPAIVGCLGALAAYLKAHTTKKALNTHLSDVTK